MEFVRTHGSQFMGVICTFIILIGFGVIGIPAANWLSVPQAPSPAVGKVPDPPDSFTKEYLHGTMHHIRVVTLLEAGGCTAYAIGPHALLTASHCELGTDEITIDEKKVAVIARRLRDGADHTILLLVGIEFHQHAHIAPATEWKPVMGERVFSWGNPEKLRDQYREGYAVGVFDDEGMDGKKLKAYLFDYHVEKGDSGSSLFNSKGQIIGVLSIKKTNFMGLYPMEFRPWQITMAERY